MTIIDNIVHDFAIIANWWNDCKIQDKMVLFPKKEMTLVQPPKDKCGQPCFQIMAEKENAAVICCLVPEVFPEVRRVHVKEAFDGIKEITVHL